MRKHYLLPGLALIGGILGFALRRWQLASAYLPDTQLFVPRAPATLALLGVLAVVLLALLVLSRGLPPQKDFLPAFRCPSAGFMTLLAISGFLVLGAGVLGFLRGTQLLSLWRLYPDSSVQLSWPLMQLVCAFLCLPAGLALLALGKCGYRDTLSSPALRLAPFPAFAGLVWVLSTHLLHGIDPVLMRYGFLLAAAALLTLAHYEAAAFLFHRCRPGRMVAYSLSGTVLGLTALADLPAFFDVLMVAGLSLSALTLSWALLHRPIDPPLPGRMPSGAMEEHSDET